MRRNIGKTWIDMVWLDSHVAGKRRKWFILKRSGTRLWYVGIYRFRIAGRFVPEVNNAYLRNQALPPRHISPFPAAADLQAALAVLVR